MKVKLNYTNLIDSYKNGTLSPKELHEVEEMIDTNTDFKEELKLSNEIEEAVLDQDTMRFEKTVFSVHGEFSKIRRRRAIMQVAASILFVIVVGGLFWMLLPKMGSNYSQLADKYYKTYEPITAVRSGDQPLDQLLAEAFDMFTRKDFNKAARKFQDLLVLNPSNNMARFYLGISLMENGKPAEAIPHMQEIVDQKDVLYKNQAEWYMALCFLKTNEKEKAIKHLKSLVSNSGHYKDQAQKLIKDLK